jgi:hypothetical protein
MNGQNDFRPQGLDLVAFMGFPLLASIFQSGTQEHARFAKLPLQADVLFSATL